MVLLQLQQAQAQAAHMEMVKQAFAEAAAKGMPEPTILPPGGLPRPGAAAGPGMMAGLPGLMGMAGLMAGMSSANAGVPPAPTAAPSSASSVSGPDGSLESATKDFMRRNMLPPSFREKLSRQLERKGDNWKVEMDRLDKELVDADIPPILRPQFLMVTFGDIVPQKWTDYDETPAKKQQGSLEGGSAGLPARGSGRSRSRKRSRSRDRRERRSRSRQNKSRSRSRKRDKER